MSPVFPSATLLAAARVGKDAEDNDIGQLMLIDIQPGSFELSPESSAQSLLHETKHCKQSVNSVRRVVLVKKEDIKN